MIPLKDTIPSRRFPLVNTTIIALNVLAFLVEISMGQQVERQIVFTFGLVPARFWAESGIARWLPVFSSMFLHGGWWHIISNMLALYIFGDNVEDRLGHTRYLIFYLLGGVLAALAQIWAYPGSTIPTIGASGAIAAVLGAYFVLYPLSRVITLIPIPVFFFFPIVEIPALIYLGFWFLSQLFNGTFALTANAGTLQNGGVAWWAHIGGFIAGMILVKIFAVGSSPPRHSLHRDVFYPDEYYPW
ncbi:MAG TPA: rhomboid family intramembrane serine protease [Anaerolineae bacterium]|nr:rhomboid family intramembrane serine protease [Anaerolineae bacterium]